MDKMFLFGYFFGCKHLRQKSDLMIVNIDTESETTLSRTYDAGVNVQV